MGSVSSSQIKSIHIDQKDVRNDTSAGGQISKMKVQDCTDIENFVNSREFSVKKKSTVEIEMLTKQLCESESVRLDLEDRIQGLEEQIQYLSAQNLMKEEKPCDETLLAKDLFIAKLEKEKKELENESKKLKQQHRKKMKQQNMQLAEYKQEVNFQLMELKDEIQKLKQENQALKEPSTSFDANNAKSSYVSNSNDTNLDTATDQSKLYGDEKMKLILELSEQVTEQQEKITKLEKKLKERDQVVDDLRYKLKTDFEYLKVSNISQDKTASKNQSVNSESHSGSSGSSKLHYARAADTRKGAVSVTTGGMFTVDEKKYGNDGEHMLKLSSFLKGITPSNNKHRTSKDVFEDSVVLSELVGKTEQLINLSLESGNGRDSGLGSAGKRDEKSVLRKEIEEAKLHNSSSHSMETGSDLSESDFEHNISNHKISSAPPKLQNGGSRKLKKKSSSLRKYSDRPPRPTLAFEDAKFSVNESENLYVHPLPTVTSPV